MRSWGSWENSGFPHFRTDKIPWYFHDFSRFSKKFQVYFLNIFNVTSNYFWINVYIKISPNQKYIISTVSQGSHISGVTKFHDISMIFIIFCKIPWCFPGLPGVLYFSRFSSKCGNPETGLHQCTRSKARSFQQMHWILTPHKKCLNC